MATTALNDEHLEALATACSGTLLGPTDVGYNRGAGANLEGGSSALWFGHRYPAGPGTGDSAGKYFFVFTGTSSATPQVAGLAGLLFSHLAPPANGRLNELVRDTIERTCEKVGGPACYPLMTSGKTWSVDRGFGRIDAALALA